MTDQIAHTPSLACGCPACLAALDLVLPTGSVSLSVAAVVKPVSADFVQPVVAASAVQSVAVGAVPSVISAPSTSAAPVSAPVAASDYPPSVNGSFTFGINSSADGYDLVATVSSDGFVSGNSYLAFQASAGSSYYVTFATNYPLTVGVYDSNGILRNSSNVSGYTFTAATTGTYYIQVSNYSLSGYSYSVTLHDRIGLPPDPSTATYQDNFWSLLQGGSNFWRDKSFTGAVQETTDGISGARHVITYSFAASSTDLQGNDYAGFQAMSASEQAAVRAALGYISSQYDITFVEVAAGQGDIRYATNDQGSVSEAYTSPDFSGQGTSVFLNNSGLTNATDYSTGTDAYQTILRETGHALGLKYSGSGSPSPQLPATTDDRTHSIMSYNDAANTTYYTVTGTAANYTYQAHTIYASSYQLYDYDALQYLYGARTGVHLGDVSFAFDPVMMETVYADSGLNIIDVGNQGLASNIDLRAGHFSSIAVRVGSVFKRLDLPSWATNVPDPTYDGVNNLAIAAGSHFDEAKLSSYNDTVICNDDGDTIICGIGHATITGGAGNDNFTIGPGGATIDGGGGINTATLAGNYDTYTVSSDGTTTTITIGSVTSSLTNVSSIHFRDYVYVPGDVTPPPVVTVNSTFDRAVYRQSIQVASLFSASDPSGTIDAYELSVTPNGYGYLLFDGSHYMTLDVAATDLASVYYVAGTITAGDQINIQAIDHANHTTSKTAGVVVSITAPKPPALTILNSTVTTAFSNPVALSTLFSATDASGTIDSYQFSCIATGSPETGHFRVNGVDYAIGQAVTVEASDLASAYFVPGSVNENDTLSIVAVDNATFTQSPTGKVDIIVTRPTAPVINIAQTSLSAAVHQSFQVSSLFSATDNRDTIASYVLVDSATGSTAGHFRVGSVDYQSGATVTIAATDLASTVFIAGTGGTDVISIQAVDGQGAGGAKTVSVAVTSAPAPAVTPASGGTVNVAYGQSLAASSLFSVTDPDGLAITQYRFVDLTPASDSGYFSLDGVKQTGDLVPFTIDASQLSQLTFRSGSGTDQIEIQAYNGFSWSTAAVLTVTAPVDHAPVVTGLTPAPPPVPGGAVAVSSLFTVTDPDSDPIVEYQVSISGQGSKSGYLSLNGVRVTGNVATISASDLASLTVTVGTVSSDVSIWAFDGFDWSTPAVVHVVGSHIVPTVSALSATVAAGHLQTYHFSDLFAVSDPQKSAVQYDFLDNTPGDGTLYVNGVAQAAGTDVIVAASNLSSVSFVASGSDTLSARVFDGQSWSARTKVTITAPPDQAPLPVSALPLAVQPRVGTVIAASSLFVPGTDPDGDAITQYRFWDATPGGGTLRVGGVNQVNNVATVAASNLGSVTFTAGASDQLYIRSYDGLTWSPWKIVTIAGANLLPVVTAHTAAVSATHLQSFGFSDLFSATDPQNSAITKYDFYDGTVGDGSIELNGAVQAAQTDIVVSASQLSSLSFVASGGSDTLYARAWDGYSWSARTKVTITAPPDQAPGITATNSTVQTTIGTVLQGSNLFSASDPDQDPITKYRFQDLTPGGGTLRIGGVNQVNTAAIVTADHLGSVTFTAGKNDQVRISAFDGISWSTWTTLTITGSPVAAAPLQSILQPATSPAWGFAAAG